MTTDKMAESFNHGFKTAEDIPKENPHQEHLEEAFFGALNCCLRELLRFQNKSEILKVVHSVFDN